MKDIWIIELVASNIFLSSHLSYLNLANDMSNSYH